VALSAGQVSLPVKPDASGFGADLHKSIMGQSGGISAAGKVVGTGILAGAAAVIAAGAAVLTVGFQEAMDASAGTAQLEAGIKSTGGAAGVTADGLNALAGSIQGYSGQTDDSIVAAEQLLLTFTNIKNSGTDKIFDQATVASANMAAKMGGDASGSAIMLGKALNDPVAGITSLTRAGVQFTDGQKESIKAMVEAGDTVGAQKIILGELETQFGGAAEAAGNSLPGQLEKGKRAFEDLSQTVVTVILPMILPAITGIADKIKTATPAIKDFAEAFSKNVKEAIEKAQPVIKTIGDFVTTTLVPGFKSFGDYVTGTIVPAMQDLWKWVGDNKTMLEGIAVMIIAAVVAFQAYSAVMTVIKVATIAWTVVQGILNGTLIANPIGLVVMAIAALVAGIVWVATQTTFFQTVWAAVWGGVTTAFSATVAFLKGLFNAVWETIKTVFGWSPLGIIITNWDSIIGFFSGLGAKIGTAASGMWGGIKDSFKTALNWIIDKWNNFKFTLGGGNILGFDIPEINLETPNIPRLAEGGVVPATPGGRLVRVAEAGESEVVAPLSKFNDMVNGASGKGVVQNIYPTPGLSEQQIGDAAARQLAWAMR